MIMEVAVLIIVRSMKTNMMKASSWHDGDESVLIVFGGSGVKLLWRR